MTGLLMKTLILSFFFTVTKVRKAKNNIILLYNEQEEMLTKPEDVQGELVGFYKTLLYTAAPALQAIDLQTMRVGPMLSHEAGSMLIQPIIVNELN